MSSVFLFVLLLVWTRWRLDGGNCLSREELHSRRNSDGELIVMLASHVKFDKRQCESIKAGSLLLRIWNARHQFRRLNKLWKKL